MNIPHYPHRRVPWDAAGRSQARPRGDAHPRACGRGPGISPPWPSVARVAPAYRIYSEEEFLAAEDWQGEAGAVAGSGAELEPAYELELEPEFNLLGEAGPRRRAEAVGAPRGTCGAHPGRRGGCRCGCVACGPDPDRRAIADLPEELRLEEDRRRRSWPIASSIRPLDARPRKRTRQASVPARLSTARRSRPVGRPPIAAHPHRPPQPTPPAETASAPTTAPTTATPTTAA